MDHETLTPPLKNTVLDAEHFAVSLQLIFLRQLIDGMWT